MGGNNKESIRQSIARIVRYSKSEIDEGNIILATVDDVFSDVLDTATFGTMNVTLQPSEVQIPSIPLNAHINDDGSTSISGKYTFPKVNSDVFLILDYKNGVEYYYPLFYSHVDQVYEQYDSEKISRVVEVDTPDENNPYDTTETGNYSEISQSHTSLDTIIEDSDGNSYTESKGTTSIDEGVTDGSDTTSVSSTASSRTIETGVYKINTNTAASEESAVLGDTAVDLIGQILDAIQLITVTAPSGVTSVPINANTFATIKTQLDTMLATNIKLK